MKKIVCLLMSVFVFSIITGCISPPMNNDTPKLKPSAYSSNLSDTVYRGEPFRVDDDLVWRTGDNYTVHLL